MFEDKIFSLKKLNNLEIIIVFVKSYFKTDILQIYQITYWCVEPPLIKD